MFIRRTLVIFAAAAAFGAIGLVNSYSQSDAAAEHELDQAHTSFYFRIGHLGISEVYGRFNRIDGTIVYNEQNPQQSRFEFTIDIESIDTGNERRDNHLRSPDFFNARQFPQMTFKSTSIEPHDDAWHVTGDLTLHGVTRSVTVPLRKLGEAEFHGQRVGFAAEFPIKRSDFGMDNMLEAVGDEVEVLVSFEGIK